MRNLGSGGASGERGMDHLEARKTFSAIRDEGLGRGDKGDYVTVKVCHIWGVCMVYLNMLPQVMFCWFFVFLFPSLLYTTYRPPSPMWRATMWRNYGTLRAPPATRKSLKSKAAGGARNATKVLNNLPTYCTYILDFFRCLILRETFIYTQSSPIVFVVTYCPWRPRIIQASPG
jgi:hypothetical protein